MDYNNKNNFLCLSRLQAKDQKAIGVAMAKELLLNFIKKKKKLLTGQLIYYNRTIIKHKFIRYAIIGLFSF